MGYALSTLGNLPVQDEISLYIFVVGSSWKDEAYQAIEDNFMALAKQIGPTAVIAKGFEPEVWSSQVCDKYLGKSTETLYDVFPALLLTDSHPDRLIETSMRLLVPLRDAQKRFGGAAAFFDALSEFARTRNPSFLARFEEKSTIGSKAWSVLELKPSFFGFGINIKELVARVQGK
jgi:hypothetical protein